MPNNDGAFIAGAKPASGLAHGNLITIYVATCQVAPFESARSGDAGSSHVTSASLSAPSFRPVKFPDRVAPTATVEAIQKFLISKWMISKSPYLQLPAGEQFYTFKGRILRLDGTLDAYCECISGSKRRTSMRFASPLTTFLPPAHGRSGRRGHHLPAVRIAGEDLRPLGHVHERVACRVAGTECVRAEAAA